MANKPVVLVTRKLPSAVEDRLKRDYDARLNPDDRLYSEHQLIDRARGAQAILPCHTEHFSADVIRRLPAEVKIIPTSPSASTTSTSRPPRRKALSSPTPRTCCRTPLPS